MVFYIWVHNSNTTIMKPNFIIFIIAAIVPMIMGFLWYGPMLFQNIWMKESGMTEEKMKSGNMVLIFGLSYVCSLLIAFFLQFVVIHQYGVFQTLINEPGFKEESGTAFNAFTEFMTTYGNRFRSFSHGAIHGVMTGLFLITPIITIKSLFERKSFKYIAINTGYWIITLAVMGGIICKWA